MNETLHLSGVKQASGVRLVQGSHIVTRKLYEHDCAYIFQNADGRVIFTIPWEDAFTMIGTTDQDFSGTPETVVASADEIAYLCRSVDEYLERPVSPADVVWSWSGVRALADDGASEARQATRDYVLHLDAPAGGAPLLSVYGGKITTYRRLAEAALKKLAPHLDVVAGRSWTGAAPLPGGHFPRDGLEALIGEILKKHAFLSPEHARRFARSYGDRAFLVLGDAERASDLGEVFVKDLTAREVDFLMDHEWAMTAEDVLVRRSKLVLWASEAQTERVAAYMRDRRSNGPIPNPAEPALQAPAAI